MSSEDSLKDLSTTGRSGATTRMAKEPKTVNIFIGFFFMVNFCLGTGFLGVPYSFFYSGYLLAVPTMLVIAFVTWLTGSWYVECMARAQAVETLQMEKTPSESGSLPIPKFEITIYRNFEPAEMFQLFFNKWVRYLYIIILSVYCLFASWSFCTVAGSAWASNIPFHSSGIEKCDDEAFHHHLLPSPQNCLHSYYVSLSIFGFIVIVLSLLDLKEQAIVQIIMGLLRFVTVGAILLYSIVKLAGGGDACVEDLNQELPSGINNSASILPWFNFSDNATRYSSYKQVVVDADVAGWVGAIPVVTYAFIVHQGIPSLTQPIKQKRYLHYLMMAMFGTATFCYLSLGVVVPLWFKADAQETITLSFGKFTMPHHPLPMKILAYYLILFPSLDVMSAYPLMVHVIVNNIYSLLMEFIKFTVSFTRLDFSKIENHERLILFAFRFVVAFLPLLLALAIANLIYVLKFAGMFGFFICFFFPAALQLRSIVVCKRLFGQAKPEVHQGIVAEEALSEETPLIQSQNDDHLSSKKSYVTPYSLGVFSHPIMPVIVAGIGAVLFGFTIASWLVSPHKITCSLDN